MPKIELSIEVNASAHSAYNNLLQFEEYSNFVEGISDLQRLDAKHFQLQVEKGGKEVQCDVELLEQVPNQSIGFRIKNAAKAEGKISIQPLADNKSRITLSADAELGASSLLGDNAKTATEKIRQNLSQLKELIEMQEEDMQSTQRTSASAQTQTAGRSSSASKSQGQTGSLRTQSTGGQMAASTEYQGSQDEPQYQGQFSGSAEYQGSQGEQQFRGESGSVRNQSGGGQFSGSAEYQGSQGEQQFQGQQHASSKGQQGGRKMSISAGQSQTASERSSAISYPLRRSTDIKRSIQSSRREQTSSSLSSQAWIPNMMRVWEEPFTMMQKMTEGLDQLMEKYVHQPAVQANKVAQKSLAAAKEWTPSVDIARQESNLVICADLPGIKREDVQVDIKEKKLVIEGQRREEVEFSEPIFHTSERSYGHFYREIPLPDGIDVSAAAASMHDGVLEIKVPLPRGEVYGRRLNIQSESI